MTKKRKVATDVPEQIDRGSDLMRHVNRVCSERRLRLTPLRADVLRLVMQATRPIKAYDLLDGIRASTATSAPVTAYRSLDFLLEHGFIHRLESLNAYVPCRRPGTRHTVPFLICDGCQLTIEMDDERTAQALSGDALDQGFVTTSQMLEVHGWCRDCRDLAGRPGG